MMLFLLFGGPTAELFAASYNTLTTKAGTIEVNLETYGYTRNTNSNWFKTEDNHGIYNRGTSSSWWIASPGSSFDNSGMNVNDSTGSFNGTLVDSSSIAVRPIVCIPTSVFNSKYLTSLENV